MFVNSCSKGLSGTLRAALFGSAAMVAMCAAGAAQALPQNPVVVGSTGPTGATFDSSTLNTLNVNQVDQRVVIDWRSFNIDAGETVNFNQASPNFVAFNIVTGSEGAPGLSTINGNINATGGVWLFSPGGVLIGSTARINVGSFAAVTGEVGHDGDINQMLYANEGSGFTEVVIQGSGKAGGPLTVSSGAQIHANKGYIVLQAEDMSDSGQLTASGGVEYIVSNGGTVSFTTASGGQTLQGATAAAHATGNPKFIQAGNVHAAWVGLDAQGSKAASDFHGVINLSGVIQTTGSKPGGTNGVVILLGGDGGPTESGATGSSLVLDGSGSSINTGVKGMYVRASAVTLGDVDVGGGLDVNAYGDIIINGAVTVDHDVLLTHNILSGLAPGSVTLNGRTIVGGLLDARGANVTINAKTDVGGDLNGRAAADLLINGKTTVTGSATLTTFGGGDGIATKKTFEVGGNLTANTNGFRNFTTVTVGGATNVTSIGNISLDGDFSSTGAATFAITGDGVMVNNHALTVGGDLTITGNAFTSNGSITSGDLDITTTGPITLAGATTVNGDAYAGTSGAVSLGNVTVHGDLDVDGGDVTVGGPVTVDGNAVLGADGVLAFNGALGAGGFVSGTGNNITLGASGVVRSDSGGEGIGDLTLVSAGNFTANAASLVIAGSNAASPTDVVRITADNNITTGQVSGRTVTITGYGSNLTTGGAIIGGQSVMISGNPNSEGGAGALNVNANVTSGGTIAILEQGDAGAVTVGASSTVQGSGQVFLSSTGDTNINGHVTGSALATYSAGALTVGASGVLNTTGTTAAPTWPVAGANVTFGTGDDGPVPNISGLTLAAHTMTLNGAVTAGPAGSRADVFVQPLGTQSAVTIGGSGSTGFNLTGASIGHVTARNLIVLGGAAEGRGAGYDLTLADLTLDVTKVGGLWLGAQSSHSITVSGTVTGGADVRLGFAQVDGGSDSLLGFTPGDINITGGLGTTASPLGTTSLLARNNIFIGSSAFITAAKADSAFDAVARSKDFTSDGHLFVAAGTLEMGAQSRIIQQNIGSGAVRFSGLSINTPTSGHPLITNVSALEGRTFGSGGSQWTAHFGAGPTQIDVFGVLATGPGTSVGDEAAAKQANLLPGSITAVPAYRINSCAFGTTCTATTDVPRFEEPLVVNINTDTTLLDNASAAGAAAGSAAGTPQVFTIQTDTEKDDAAGQGNQSPITGSGNGDLWPGAPTP
jgi:filamentous hemagglutinin family protein